MAHICVAVDRANFQSVRVRWMVNAPQLCSLTQPQAYQSEMGQVRLLKTANNHTHSTTCSFCLDYRYQKMDPEKVPATQDVLFVSQEVKWNFTLNLRTIGNDNDVHCIIAYLTFLEASWNVRYVCNYRPACVISAELSELWLSLPPPSTAYRHDHRIMGKQQMVISSMLSSWLVRGLEEGNRRK